uniref:Uncharacterized protein n=1 Tax=Rhizophora mucronata TaxID=61149 RepID=A0A2P2NU82_RHIMU
MDFTKNVGQQAHWFIPRHCFSIFHFAVELLLELVVS